MVYDNTMVRTVIKSVIVLSSLTLVFLIFTNLRKYYPEILQYHNISHELQENIPNYTISFIRKGEAIQNPWKSWKALTVLIRINNQQIISEGTGGDILSIRVFIKESKLSFALFPTDEKNGTYLCTLPLIWNGEYTIEVRLLFASKEVKLLEKYQSENFYENTWKKDAVYRKDNVEKNVECDVSLDFLEFCDLSKYNGMDPWFCPLPSGMECDDFVFDYLKKTVPDDIENREYIIKNEVTRDAYSLNVKIPNLGHDKSNIIEKIDEQCLPELSKRLMPTGYFINGEWKSLTCPHHQFSPDKRKVCLSDKNILFFGDSNSRIMRNLIMDILKDEKKVIGIDENHHIYPHLNSSIHLHYYGHGLGHWPSKGQVLKSIDDVFLIPRKEVNVIFISFWAHFTFLSEKRFISKLLYLRSKLRTWKAKYPHVDIILRSPHFREVKENNLFFLRFNNFNSQNAYLFYKRVFNKEPFHFLDMYEMLIAFGGEYKAHPHETVVDESLNFILSKICEKNNEYHTNLIS